MKPKKNRDVMISRTSLEKTHPSQQLGRLQPEQANFGQGFTNNHRTTYSRIDQAEGPKATPHSI